MKNNREKEKQIYLVFEVSVILKGIHALVEIVGGFLILFINQAYIVSRVLSITQEELSEDPKDLVANYLLHMSNSFSVSSQHFVAFYLLTHGIIKLILVVGLLKKHMWAYPTSLVVFGLFIIYQIYRFTFTHSIWLILITILDIFIIWLTWYEYQRMKRHNLFED